ncbi:hypothetical protein [Mesorhizobium sp. 43Arga]
MALLTSTTGRCDKITAPAKGNPSILLPEIEQLGVAEILRALQRFHPADEAGLQPFGLVHLMPLGHWAANLALHAVPERFALICLERDEGAASAAAGVCHQHLAAFPGARCTPMICISFSSKHLILRRCTVGPLR